MNKLFWGLLYLLSFGIKTNAQGLDIKHLTDNFYIYTTYKPINGSPFPSNSMYLVTEAGVVLFDTPWDMQQTYPLLDSIEQKHQKKVIACIVTHFHDDRTAGLDLLKLKGIATYSSLQTWCLCKERDEHQAAHYFTADTTFQFGQYQVQTFYPGEGHTSDNIVLWFPVQRILYGGCLVKSTEAKGLGNVADANVAAWAATIKTVLQRFPRPRFVIPGHHSWRNRKSLQHTLRLLKR